MSTRRSFTPNLIYCDGIPIQRVDEFKYLDILLDSKLTFEPHAQSLLRRLAPSSMPFAKCRYFMSIKAAEIVFKSFLLPIVEHGALFLSLCSANVVKKVQSHINRLLRIVYKQPPRTANRDLYTRSRVLPLTLPADAALLTLQFGMREVDDRMDVAAQIVMAPSKEIFKRRLRKFHYERYDQNGVT